jgi:hypothetical protein
MAKAKAKTRIEITPPNFKTIQLRIEGTAPLMTHKFSEKMRRQIEEKQTARDATAKKREPKDYAAEFNAARYIARGNGRKGGWDGVPCGAIRAAMIAACRTVDGLPMTRAKGAFFIKAQGHDTTDGTPLVRIIGEAVHDTRPVRLESGVADMRNRPRYDDWAMELEIEFDADMISERDVANLLARAGAQVGLCELRPQAPNSFGGDFGTFGVKTSMAKSAPKQKPSLRAVA